MRTLLAVFLASFFFVSPKLLASPSEALKYLPVQDGGRIKPFDTFARESLELVYGKSHFDGKPANEIVLTWLLEPAAWEEKPIIEVRHHLVKKALELSAERRHFSPKQILSHPRLSMLMQELASQRETKQKLDPYFQALQRLEHQIVVLREIATGRWLKLIPPKPGETGHFWRSVAEFDPQENALFSEIGKGFVAAIGKGESQQLKEAVNQFVAYAKNQNSEKYADSARIRFEVHYHEFHPFRVAWIFYLLSLVSLVLVWVLRRDSLYKLAWVLSGIGLLFHFYGFGLRIYLAERAPVSNMYETVVWVALGAVIFAMIMEAIYRWRFILTAGAAVAAFCLILADLAPAVLDPTLQPLEPVLRSNFWLTTHVLTITISYAAFFLAFALSDIGLFFFIKDEKFHQPKIRALVLATYRSMQIGVAFLAPGIILGGIWADYSWGRFWGWDPKETWALIALLGYLAVMHGRLAGILKDFGILASGIVTFSLVIMAWYGVNFVLGAGLHSYGFGAGGVEYVAAFVALHLLYVLFAYMVRRERLK